MSPITARLAALPARMGGLGLRMWTLEDCQVAYTAGASAAARVLHKYDARQLLPLAQPRADPALEHALQCLADAGLPVRSAPLEHAPKRWQSALMQQLHNARKAALMTDMTPAARARMDAASQAGASAWMTAMPVSAFALTDLHLQRTLRLWLGLRIQAPVTADQALPGCCTHAGKHPLNCPLVDASQRHAIMRAAWASIFRLAGLSAQPVTVPAVQPAPATSPAAPAAAAATAAAPAEQPAAAEASEPPRTCSTSASARARSVRQHTVLATELPGKRTYVLPWLCLPKRASRAPSIPHARTVPCNWLGAPTREAKAVLRLLAKAAAARGVPAWAFDAWSRCRLSTAAARANAQALQQHIAAARGLPQHADPMGEAAAADLCMTAADAADAAGMSAVPGAPAE